PLTDAIPPWHKSFSQPMSQPDCCSVAARTEQRICKPWAKQIQWRMAYRWSSMPSSTELNPRRKWHVAEPKEMTITVDQEAIQVAEGTTGHDLFGDEKTTVVMTVDGNLQDLFRVIPEGATVERVDITDQAGLEVLRHSIGHCLSLFVQEMYA